jgi:hypothetical protein
LRGVTGAGFFVDGAAAAAGADAPTLTDSEPSACLAIDMRVDTALRSASDAIGTVVDAVAPVRASVAVAVATRPSAVVTST